MKSGLGVAVAGGSLFFGVICGAAVLVGSAANFDYADADEDAQQRYLENTVSGIKTGFSITAGDSAKITRIKADAAFDLIALDIKFHDPRIDHAGYEDIEAFRETAFRQICRDRSVKTVVTKGVSLKLRMLRPNGGSLSTFTFNEESCAPFLVG
ncbi:MAG: hypothetical protein WD076_07115 [Parvularculaceae bacterium]